MKCMTWVVFYVDDRFSNKTKHFNGKKRVFKTRLFSEKNYILVNLQLKSEMHDLIFNNFRSRLVSWVLLLSSGQPWKHGRGLDGLENWQ